MPSSVDIIRIATERAREDSAMQEREILAMFNNTANELTDQIARYTKADKVAPARLNILLKSVKDESRLLRTQVANRITRGMKNSVDYGLKTGILSLESSLPSRFKLGIGSSFIDKSGKVIRNNSIEEIFTDSKWAKINGDAMDYLFRFAPGGDTLSSRIWDGIHQSEKAIRNRIQMAVLSGESSARLSLDIRKYLVQPKTLRGTEKALYHPGMGVYKSAYKNAMRVARTEMARAYTEGTFRYANQKDWIKGYIWKIGGGNPCPICSDSAETYWEKADPPPIPAHPQCKCYVELVMDDKKVEPIKTKAAVQ